MNLRKAFLNARSYWSWRLYYRARGRPLIRVIGDSHCGPYRGAACFHVHHISPATAHNLCEPKSTTNSHEQLMSVVRNMDLDREYAMLVFGEIDCRIHIYGQFKRRKEKVSITELIGNTIERYGRVMRELRELGTRVIVHGIIPATHQGNRYKVEHYATPDMHLRIYREFNARLREFCAENDFLFVDIQDATADAEGFIAPEFAHGDAHLNRKVVPIVRRILAEANVPVG